MSVVITREEWLKALAEAPPTRKLCRQCGAAKPLTEYYRQLGKLTARCKQCRSQSDRKRYLENKDRILDQHREYCQRNSAKVARLQREYRLRNRDKLLSQARERAHLKQYWRKQLQRYRDDQCYRERIQQRQRAYYANNSEQILERARRRRSLKRTA